MNHQTRSRTAIVPLIEGDVKGIGGVVEITKPNKYSCFKGQRLRCTGAHTKAPELWILEMGKTVPKAHEDPRDRFVHGVSRRGTGMYVMWAMVPGCYLCDLKLSRILEWLSLSYTLVPYTLSYAFPVKKTVCE